MLTASYYLRLNRLGWRAIFALPSFGQAGEADDEATTIRMKEIQSINMRTDYNKPKHLNIYLSGNTTPTIRNRRYRLHAMK